MKRTAAVNELIALIKKKPNWIYSHDYTTFNEGYKTIQELIKLELIKYVHMKTTSLVYLNQINPSKPKFTFMIDQYFMDNILNKFDTSEEYFKLVIKEGFLK